MTDPDSIRSDAILSAADISPGQARDAALVLAGHAAGAGELGDWLEMCGLLDYTPGGPGAGPYGRPRQQRTGQGGS